MAVSHKTRRTIDVNGRRFLWYVADDIDDFPRTVSANNLHALNIVSEDKAFLVRFHLGQQHAAQRHITVLGREFTGASTGECWRRFRCPDWCPDGKVTPKTVRAIIEWCHDPSILRVEVDYRGVLVAKGPRGGEGAAEEEIAD